MLPCSKKQVPVRWRYIDTTGLNAFTVPGERRGKAPRPIQKVRQDAVMSAYVHDDEHRCRAVGRDASNNGPKRLETSRRRRDEYDCAHEGTNAHCPPSSFGDCSSGAYAEKTHRTIGRFPYVAHRLEEPSQAPATERVDHSA